MEFEEDCAITVDTYFSDETFSNDAGFNEMLDIQDLAERAVIDALEKEGGEWEGLGPGGWIGVDSQVWACNFSPPERRKLTRYHRAEVFGAALELAFKNVGLL